MPDICQKASQVRFPQEQSRLEVREQQLQDCQRRRRSICVLVVVSEKLICFIDVVQNNGVVPGPQTVEGRILARSYEPTPRLGNPLQMYTG